MRFVPSDPVGQLCERIAPHDHLVAGADLRIVVLHQQFSPFVVHGDHADGVARTARAVVNAWCLPLYWYQFSHVPRRPASMGQRSPT